LQDPLACEQTAAAMRGYSPFDGMRCGQHYPPMLCSVAEHDARVPFTQALRYAHRLRARSGATAASAPFLLHVNPIGGHLGDGGRYRRFEHASVELAFVMHAVGATLPQP
jgi:protease II